MCPRITSTLFPPNHTYTVLWCEPLVNTKSYLAAKQPTNQSGNQASLTHSVNLSHSQWSLKAVKVQLRGRRSKLGFSFIACLQIGLECRAWIHVHIYVVHVCLRMPYVADLDTVYGPGWIPKLGLALHVQLAVRVLKNGSVSSFAFWTRKLLDWHNPLLPR